jgi:WD40 repeat protein
MKIAAGIAVLFASHLALADRITTIAVTRDGKSAVVGSADKTLRVLSLPDGRELRKWAVEEIPMSIALAPDGKRLAVGSFGELALFDPGTGTKLASEKDPIGHGGVNSVAFAPNGKTIAVAGDFGRAALVDPATAKVVRKLEGFHKIVNAIAFAPDGKEVAAAGVDRTVELWSAGGEPGRTLAGHQTWIASLAFSPDGKQIFSVDERANVLVWERGTGKQVEALRGDSGWTYALAVAPDGKTLAWGAEEGVQLWNLGAHKAGDKLATARSQITAVAYLPNGKQLVVGDYAGHLSLFDIAKKTSAPLTK